MADSKFNATSATLSVGRLGMSGFTLVGHFVLNDSIHADGIVFIEPSRIPGEDSARLSGGVTDPQLSIVFNSGFFDLLLQNLRAATSVEIRFITPTDIGSTSSIPTDSLRILTRRKFD